MRLIGNEEDFNEEKKAIKEHDSERWWLMLHLPARHDWSTNTQSHMQNGDYYIN